MSCFHITLLVCLLDCLLTSRTSHGWHGSPKMSVPVMDCIPFNFCSLQGPAMTGTVLPKCPCQSWTAFRSIWKILVFIQKKKYWHLYKRKNTGIYTKEKKCFQFVSERITRVNSGIYKKWVRGWNIHKLGKVDLCRTQVECSQKNLIG